jgi:uncharacterized membrane protein YdfJ with MMPL/SSD domain
MDKKIILYIIIAVAIVILLLFTFFPNVIHIFKDSGVSGEDKCAPPPGQTEEAWQEHMSHHPNVYKECLS